MSVSKQSNAAVNVQANFFANGQPRTFSTTGLTQIVVLLCDGDDRVQITADITTRTIIDGGAGNDRLEGGAGPNVLLGAEGADRLTGGKGRDLLIGGLGADQLEGKDGDDILIGGRTIFDIDDDHVAAGFDEALSTILAEWNSTRAYATRVANIRGTGSGPRLNGSYFLQDAVTVLDDAIADTLTGSAGQNWFFYKSGQDKLTERKPDEWVN